MIVQIFSFIFVFLSTILFSSDQALLEQHYTQLAQTGLNTVFGHNQFVVRVKPEMTIPRYRVKYTGQSKIRSSRSKKSKDKVYLLPGYPALKNLSPSQFNQLPYDSITTLVDSKIKKIFIYMIVNKAMPKPKLSQAKRLLTDLLGLDLSRDEISVRFRVFEDLLKDEQKSSSQGKVLKRNNDISLFSLNTFFYLLFGCLIVVFILIYTYFQYKRSKQKSQKQQGPSIQVNPNIEFPEFGGGGPVSAAGGKEDDGLKRYFSYVNHSNIDYFIYLIKQEKLNMDQISVIFSFLPTGLVSKFIKDFSIDDLGNIVQKLIVEKVISRKFLDQIDLKFKNSMECLVGGDRSLQQFLEVLDSQKQLLLLSSLRESNQEAYAKVRSLMVMFDDLLFLDDDEMKLLIAEFNVELIGEAICQSSEELVDKIKNNMANEAQSMLMQFLKLKSDNIAVEDSQRAQQKIMKLADQLEKQGALVLKEKIKDMEG